MQRRVGLGKSFDLGVRKLKILKKDVDYYYVNGLCDTQFIIESKQSKLVEINDHEKTSANLLILFRIDLFISRLNRLKQWMN